MSTTETIASKTKTRGLIHRYLRSRGWGIDQPLRSEKARSVANSARPMLWKIFDDHLLDSGDACDSRQALSAACRLVPDFARECVRFNLVLSEPRSRSLTPVPEARREEEWQKLQKLLPTFRPPELPQTLVRDLDCGRPMTEIIGEPDFRRFAEQVVEAQVAYLAEMIVCGGAGVVLYRTPKTAAYSYVLRRLAVTVSKVNPEMRNVRHHPDAPFGQRVEYTATFNAKGSTQHTTEEHVHHLKQPAEQTFDEFRRNGGGGSIKGRRPAAPGKAGHPLPQRVAELADAVPEHLAPHLKVLEGTIVEEEIHRREMYRTEWATTIERTWKDSPAITLGDLVLTGWSDSEHDGRQGASDRARINWWAVGGAAALSGLVLFASWGRPVLGKLAAKLLV